MKIHHLNCGTFRPADPAFGDAEFVCHCLLLDVGDRLVLIDTGIGLQDIADPAGRLQHWFLGGVRPVLDPAETAIEQIRRLGYHPDQVGDIVLTHLDRDHVGGLADFPRARIHAAPEARAAMTAPLAGRDQERIQSAQWAHGVAWADQPIPASTWKGFRAWALPELDGVLLIDLPGHSTGHAGVAIATADGWLLHAGDAYFHRSQIVDAHQTPAAIAAFTSATQQSGTDRASTEQALTALAADPDVTVFAAHDPSEFHRLRG